VLVLKHKVKTETVKVQLKKMMKFKQFMTVKDFGTLTRQAMSQNMKKPPVI